MSLEKFITRINAALKLLDSYTDPAIKKEIDKIRSAIKTISTLVENTSEKQIIIKDSQNKIRHRAQAIRNIFGDKSRQYKLAWLAKHIANLGKEYDSYQEPACRIIAQELGIDDDELETAIVDFKQSQGLEIPQRK